MLARDIATKDIPALEPTMLIHEALNLMNKHKVSQIPIVSNKDIYIGLIDEQDINYENSNDIIENINIRTAESTKISDSQHFFSIFDIISAEHVSMVAVVDEYNNYIGNIPQQIILETIADILTLRAQGGIIILDVKHRDYSIAQISQIIETNGAKILNLCTSTSAKPEHFQITLKINTPEITSIVETFIRYNYHVQSFFGEYNKLEDLYRSRIDEFKKFLNI